MDHLGSAKDNEVSSLLNYTCLNLLVQQDEAGRV